MNRPPKKSPSKPNRSAATLKFISRELGISAATVSRALRPETEHMVKEATRKSILEMADRVGFVPNPGAQLLLKGSAPSLTLVVPLDEEIFISEYYGRLMAGVLHAVADTDWEVRISAVDAVQGYAPDRLRQLGATSSGVLFAGLPLTQEQVTQLGDYRRPLVLLGSSLPPQISSKELPVSVVEADQYGGGKLAVDHLISLGHRRIGILSGPTASRDFSGRLRGFRDGLKVHGLECEDDLFYEGSFEQASGRNGCEKLMKIPTPPTALLCANDQVAIGALDYAKQAGIACPDQLSILGFDDGFLAEKSYPPLTTVQQPLAEMTGYAVRTLQEASEGRSVKSRQFPCRLISRGSCSSVS